MTSYAEELEHDLRQRARYTDELKRDLRQRAEKGYAWLLESGPQYGLHVENIRPDSLYLSSSCNCVLGQLGGSFGKTLDRIHSGKSSQEAQVWAIEHGFYAGSMAQKTYPLLTDVWRALLAERQPPE